MLSHKNRRLLFWSLAVIFIFATTTISLYATGYRFNLNWPIKINKILQKTGALFLNSEPTGAQVILTGHGGKELKITSGLFGKKSYQTPIKIKNLLPGEYFLEMTKDGYWPYKKIVNVFPGSAAYVEDVVLFRQDSPLKIQEAKLQKIKLTADKQNLILEKDQKIISLKTEKEVNVTLTNTTEPDLAKELNIVVPKDIKYFTKVNSEQILYANDLEVYLFNLQSGQKSLITRVSQPIIGLIFQPKGFAIYSTDTNIYLINLKDRSNVTLLASMKKLETPVLNAKGDTLYFTALNGDGEGLYKLAIK
ncbi:MAG TPA: PEGA domain-containing protein [bacterium]|nr:PEGA domain-containing protein [bacterium]HPT29713.1 PEGA domain-containing protein [bacterium]